MKHLKEKCIGCERSKSGLKSLGINFNKEHLTPAWLVRRCGTDRTLVCWQGKKVPGLSVTIPLCEECNSIFGEQLEKPVISIFDALEAGVGITDYQAEILIRWMWKFEGIHWHLRHADRVYSEKYTLRERVLRNIDQIRPLLTLSVSRIAAIDASHGDKPMGIDSFTEHSGLFVAGVFSELAIMTSFREFDMHIPYNFSQYHLKPKLDAANRNRTFFPKVGFKDDNEAVAVTVEASKYLERVHDGWSIWLQRQG